MVLFPYTEEVAAQGYDKQQGGTGLAHTHKFKGDNRVFYMPNSSMSHATFDTMTFQNGPSNRAVIPRSWWILMEMFSRL